VTSAFVSEAMHVGEFGLFGIEIPCRSLKIRSGSLDWTILDPVISFSKPLIIRCYGDEGFRLRI